jgi:AmmeMemoRadiSam system protein A
MDTYLELAKLAVEEYVKNRRIIRAPQNLLPEGYSRRAGVFVTIFKNKELRGCIGTYLPTKANIAEEIVWNAVAACSKDFRFEPIAKEELPQLRYEVSILSNPQPITDLKKHNPKEHGIIIKCKDGRCGLLLPDLEGINSAEEQVAIAARKGGIELKEDGVQLYYFSVEKHK